MTSQRTPRPWMLALILVAATLCAYLPAMGAGTIWDDDAYLTDNPLLGSLAGLGRIWIPGYTPQYYPAVFTAFWIETRLFGAHPAGFHVVNIALHAVNALLVWRLCRVLRIPGAWFIGAVFALHPVHVESVAWITERKNVLSGSFYLLAALAYQRFDELRPGARPWRWYALSLLFFTLALLSKTVTCTLPAALVLMLLWRQKRLTRRTLTTLLPMLLLGAALAFQTAYLERTRVGATGPDFAFSLAQRVMIAGKALVFYPQKLLFPWPLSFIYPRWSTGAASLASYAPVAVVLALGGAALWAAARGVRGPALALLYYAGTLFPALGFLNVYPMRYSFVADHFQYLASLGIIVLVVGAAATAVRSGALAGGICALILAASAVATWRQCSIYADEETLWRATLEHNPGAWIAHNNLASLALKRGAYTEALAHLQQGLALTESQTAVDQMRLNIAITLGKLGRFEEALHELEAVQRSSGGMEVKEALMLERLGRDQEALELFNQALAGSARSEALVPFALHLLRQGLPEDAVPWLEEHVRQHPDDPNARMFLADAYAGADRLADAIAAAERAQRLALDQGLNALSDSIRQRLLQYRAGAPPGVR